MSKIKKIEISRADFAGLIHLDCPACATSTTHNRMQARGPVAYPCGGCGVPWMGDKDIRRNVLEFYPPVQVGGEYGYWLPDVAPFMPKPVEIAPPTAADVARLWDRCAEAWKDAAVICGQENQRPQAQESHAPQAATSEAYSLQAQAMADDTRYRHAMLEEDRLARDRAVDEYMACAAERSANE